MDGFSKITDKELERLIDSSRVNSYVPGSIYHRYVAEKVKREKKKDLEREQERLQTGKEQFNSVAVRLDKIINLLELIGKHPWWASIAAFIFAVLAGLFANLLTDYAHYLIGLVFNK